MVGDQPVSKPESFGSLTAGYPSPPPGHEEVQVSTCGFAQGEKAIQGRRRVGRCLEVGHPALLPTGAAQDDPFAVPHALTPLSAKNSAREPG